MLNCNLIISEVTQVPVIDLNQVNSSSPIIPPKFNDCCKMEYGKFD